MCESIKAPKQTHRAASSSFGTASSDQQLGSSNGGGLVNSRANHIRDSHFGGAVEHLIQAFEHFRVSSHVVCFGAFLGVPETDRDHIPPGRRGGKGNFLSEPRLLPQNGKHFVV